MLSGYDRIFAAVLQQGDRLNFEDRVRLLGWMVSGQRDAELEPGVPGCNTMLNIWGVRALFRSLPLGCRLSESADELFSAEIRCGFRQLLPVTERSTVTLRRRDVTPCRPDAVPPRARCRPAPFQPASCSSEICQRQLDPVLQGWAEVRRCRALLAWNGERVQYHR